MALTRTSFTSETGSAAGKIRAKKLSRARRHEIALQGGYAAAKARWGYIPPKPQRKRQPEAVS